MADGDEDGDNGDHVESPEMMDESMLEALLIASAGSPDAEELSDLDAIDGEFNSLNNTIDEINRYLDRWESRHDRLRAEIKEVLEDATKDTREMEAKNAVVADQEGTEVKESAEAGGSQQQSKDTGASATPKGSD